ncbi:MAG: IS3 family transposase [Acidobacteriaceae bacterium]
MKYQFILERHVRYSISIHCRVLKVSRAGYYQWCKTEVPRRQRANAELLKRTRALYTHYRGRYGSPRITRVLQREGYHCSRNRVARLMRQDGLRARPKRRYVVTTTSDHRKASPNLLDRDFTVARSNQAWLSDITYVPIGRNAFLYVAVVMDLCTRKVVGLAMRDDLSRQLVIDALRQAIDRQRPKAGLLLHSDRGVQYSADAYRAILREHGFRQSMSRKGNCWDNAPMESFFKTMKVELIYRQQYETLEEAKRSIFEYIEIFYNRQRIHSALNFQTPCAFEAINNQTTTPARTESPV